MKLLDSYLKSHDITRYQVAKVSGISPQALQRLNESDDLAKFSVNHLRGIGMLTGQMSWEVLQDLEALEASTDKLLGFNRVLRKYGVSFPDDELQLAVMISQLKNKGINVAPSSFNRLEADLENASPSQIKEGLHKALLNAIDTLTGFLNDDNLE